MSTLEALEQRKHDLRCEMVRMKAERNAAQMAKVYRRLVEVKNAEAYLRRNRTISE